MIENLSSRQKRWRKKTVSVRPDNRSVRWRAHYRLQYPGLMSSQADGTPEQIEFGQWVSEHLAYLKEVKGISMRAACKKAGVSHTQVYAWMGQPESTGYVDASPAAVKKFCKAHGFDYAEPARIFGWNAEPPADPPEEPHRDPEGFIRRAKAEAAHPKTTEERRRVLNERIENAEAAQRMQRMAEDLLREALGEEQAES